MSDMYKKSGVNLEQARSLTGLIGQKAFTGEADGIVACCDGIGSKIIPLYERKMYKTIAIDLIAASLNDLATRNARAVAFLDYIAVHELDSIAVSQIVNELSAELKKYDCKLCGGETSELPHLLHAGMIDVCGFVTGIAAETKPQPVCAGDVIIGLKSNGIHANGFTLIRELYERKKLSSATFETCLEPSFVYYNVMRQLWTHGPVKAAANITGGGIAANLMRVIPDGLDISLDSAAIPPQIIFIRLKELAGKEMWEVFNCGVGFCIVAAPGFKKEILQIASEFEPFEFGKVIDA